MEHTDAFATVYTDDSTSYASLPFEHGSVKHSASEYVRGDVHTNGVESFWSMFKRAKKGTFHKLSPKHLNRYVQEFRGQAQHAAPGYAGANGNDGAQAFRQND